MLLLDWVCSSTAQPQVHVILVPFACLQGVRNRVRVSAHTFLLLDQKPAGTKQVAVPKKTTLAGVLNPELKVSDWDT